MGTKIMAYIHSLKDKKNDTQILGEVEILEHIDNNNVTALYNGIKCRATYNIFVDKYYVDDVHGIIECMELTDENIIANTENQVDGQANPCDIQSYSALAAAKIAAELESFKGGNKETAVSKFVASTLTHFCEQNERFAEIVYKTPRTLSNCCAEIMDGCGNQISDIDVYRGAVQSYFPNADISFNMTIQINGEAPSNDELLRPPKKAVAEPKQRAVPNKPNNAACENKPVKKEDKEDTDQIQLSLF